MPRTAIDFHTPYTSTSFQQYLEQTTKTLAFCVLIIYPGINLIRRGSVYAYDGLNTFEVLDNSEVFKNYAVGDSFVVRGFLDDCKANNGLYTIINKPNNNVIEVSSSLVLCLDDFDREFRLGNYLAFTEWDENITVNGLTYMALPGYSQSAIQATNKLEDDNFEIRGFFHSNGFTRENVFNHVYDNAYCEIFICDPTTPDRGRYVINKGRLGEFNPRDNEFTAHFRSDISRLKNATIGKVYQPTCRFELAGLECQKDLTRYIETGTVSFVESNRKFAVMIDTPITAPEHLIVSDYEHYATLDNVETDATGSNWYDWWWKEGKLTFVSATNNGNENKVFQIKFADFSGLLDSDSGWLIDASNQIAFANSGSIISDESEIGLFHGARVGQNITVSGSSNNNGLLTIDDVDPSGNWIGVKQTLVNELEGSSVTITPVGYVVFELWESPLFNVIAGDTFSVIPGCDKIFTRGCVQKFQNRSKAYKVSSNGKFLEELDLDDFNATLFTYRFGGEPYLPGNVVLQPFGATKGIGNTTVIFQDNGANEGESGGGG